MTEKPEINKNKYKKCANCKHRFEDFCNDCHYPTLEKFEWDIDIHKFLFGDYPKDVINTKLFEDANKRLKKSLAQKKWRNKKNKEDDIFKKIVNREDGNEKKETC